jgi:predicted branched-subunit amino acid permease
VSAATAISTAPGAGVAPLERTTSSSWRVAREGARDITPMVIGVLPFALAIGAAIGASSLGTGAGLVSGPAILAGAAQLTVVQMLDDGAAPLVIVLSALMINARILLYSASLAPWFRGESLRRRLLLALPVIDQLQFTCVPRFEQGDLDARGRRAYYVGAAAWLATAFVVTQAAAVLAGAEVPDAVHLEVAAPLALAGLLAKSTVGARAAVAAAVAALVTVIGVVLPFRSAVLVAALAGIAAGIAFDARRGTGRSGESGS